MLYGLSSTWSDAMGDRHPGQWTQVALLTKPHLVPSKRHLYSLFGALLPHQWPHQELHLCRTHLHTSWHTRRRLVNTAPLFQHARMMQCRPRLLHSFLSSRSRRRSLVLPTPGSSIDRPKSRRKTSRPHDHGRTTTYLRLPAQHHSRLPHHQGLLGLHRRIREQMQCAYKA